MFHLLPSFCYTNLDSLLGRLSVNGQKGLGKNTWGKKKTERASRSVEGEGKWCKLSWEAQIKAPKPRSLIRLTLHCESLVQQQELFKETGRLDKKYQCLAQRLGGRLLNICSPGWWHRTRWGAGEKQVLWSVSKLSSSSQRMEGKLFILLTCSAPTRNPTSSGCKETHVTTSWQLSVT